MSRKTSAILVGERLNPVWIGSEVDHLLESLLRGVQRHAQPFDVVLADAAHEGAGELGIDCAAARSHPLEALVQGFANVTARIGMT
jgi:hypothetical protein